MEKSVHQVERNVSASFGYVKKDMLMLNDAFSDIHEKIQHLSMNQATLLEEVKKLREKIEIVDKDKDDSKRIVKKKPVKKKK